ncbi:MAG: hypothetical protein RL637_1257 [Pseudomonadota bacterium]|jgi:uncharacterized phage-associated protein
MITAQNVAEYFLFKADENEDSDVSNMKLQKLIYYAQAFHLALFDKPLFNEEFEAWMHGPVCPSIYREYKSYGSAPIPVNSDIELTMFSDEQLELLEEVYDVFGQFSAWKLRNMTHEETPWKENEETGGIITKESMMEFYKTRLK